MSESLATGIIKELKKLHNALRTLEFFKEYPQVESLQVECCRSYDDHEYYDDMQLVKIELIEGREEEFCDLIQVDRTYWKEEGFGFEVEPQTNYPHEYLMYMHDGYIVDYVNPGPALIDCNIRSIEGRLRAIAGLLHMDLEEYDYN
jgi:hypothetical protein